MLIPTILTFLTLFTTALARPTAELANVYVCEHINWGGACVNVLYAIDSGDCVSLDGTASSIRPDKGFSCTFYKNGSCRTFDGSASLKLQDPGSADLTKEAGEWNDAARGFQCFRL
ncbi:hypothetical protein DPSP01_004438 [Paraphaeosphaeria sporulosa]|uniref:Beta/gamma crystallin 'Greek key' domain-containing protein n=1 Tax=Paraphaeosphaeria sporulosa TaxID=1460663 RepID=A0A177CJU0_9PLEO|nr:uncharacterized protein CC84DRAFT_1163306 [Paraphaeosphaeria sporulosa]OAG07057.1 hypothetical protein CC84DRAFT_1163306 [Paraphaeosphaeria sporulosa]